ncbi:hypothetical protein ACFP2F_00315 [Hymenobacter artigasi]|uniref:Uncharacterized protein n=1 Tax=Hymenobacter artigasi TaxID=2719616 RepID=A0ABX1HBA8_9BACT|nr:hypothetical protein [Hymenobacter artigasi]NKI87483.1 hypothetical protein [Hymenobacter artigasi]
MSRKNLSIYSCAKYSLVYLLLNCCLISCQGASSNHESFISAAINTRPLDSLNRVFLVHAHDSAETWSDTLVSQLTHALQIQGVDTFLYYRSGCSGCDVLVEKGVSDCSCNTTEIRSYLYWQHRGHTFVKKLDCCRSHPVVSTSAAAFNFYYQYQKTFEEGSKFYRDFQKYNQAHPDNPHFLPSGPIHDLNVSNMSLRTANTRLNVQVWGGGYDSLGTPLFLDYQWRRKQWAWAKLLEKLPHDNASQRN